MSSSVAGAVGLAVVDSYQQGIGRKKRVEFAPISVAGSQRVRAALLDCSENPQCFVLWLGNIREWPWNCDCCLRCPGCRRGILKIIQFMHENPLVPWVLAGRMFRRWCLYIVPTSKSSLMWPELEAVGLWRCRHTVGHMP